MIDIQFHKNWSMLLKGKIQETEAQSQTSSLHSKINVLLKSIKPSQDIISQLQTIDPNLKQDDTIPLIQLAIKHIFESFDEKDSVFGIFKAACQAKHRISPFIATHDYRMRIQSFLPDGKVNIEASPIYHLGLDYPETYFNQHGKKLDKSAIIGPLEVTTKGELPRTRYTYGIDAGMIFTNSPIAHKKAITLELKIIETGLQANLICDEQAMSKTFSWECFGIRATSCPLPDESRTRVIEALV